MFARLSCIALALVACSTSDNAKRAVSATDTPHAGAPGGTAPKGGADKGGADKGGGQLRTGGGADGVGIAYNGSPDGVIGPIVRLGNPTIDGAQSADVIRRYLKRDVAKLRACYEQRLARGDVEGMLTASFVIAADGAVRDAKATGLDDEVSGCFARVIGEIKFPPAQGDVRVAYPFVLQPPAH